LPLQGTLLKPYCRDISYNQTTANTGSLQFNPSGSLVGVLFGTNCGGSGCSVSGGSEQWFLAGNFFNYSKVGFPNVATGTGSFSLAAAVPETSTVLSLGIGLTALAIAIQRKHRLNESLSS